MADNVPITAGSGTTIATDDVATVHYQKVKLVDGTADSSTVIASGGGVEAAALRVTVASDSSGVLSVDDNGGALTVDNAGTFAVQESGGALTALQLIDDIVATDDISTHATGTTKGAAIMAAATPTDGSVDANDLGVVAMSTDRRLHVDAQVVGQDANLTVDLGATDNAVLDQIELNTSYGDSVGGGTEAAALRVTIANDSTGVISVDDNGGTLTVDGTVTANLAAGTNTNEVVGDVAHDAAAAGNPILIAGIAQDMDDTAPPNQVSAENDATRLATDRSGAIFAHPHGPRVWSYHENSSSALTDASVHTAPAAGLSLYVTDIVFSTGSATACNIFFEEGATTVLGPYYLEAVAGRGLALHFQTPKKITAATALTVTTSAAIAHSIDVTGFIAQG